MSRLASWLRRRFRPATQHRDFYWKPEGETITPPSADLTKLKQDG